MNSEMRAYFERRLLELRAMETAEMDVLAADPVKLLRWLEEMRQFQIRVCEELLRLDRAIVTESKRWGG